MLLSPPFTSEQLLLVLLAFRYATAHEPQFERHAGQSVLQPVNLDQIPFSPSSIASSVESDMPNFTPPGFPYEELYPPQASSGQCSFWLENMTHQGIAPFAPSGSSYEVFRNVKDFGAVGNGIVDDTAAINAAISTGSRCAPGTCFSSTTTPALVYLPAGIYKISSPIILYYYTQLVGNPNCMPVLQATSNFTGAALIDADPYVNGNQAYFNTNVFWRQIRNLVLDMTKMPPGYEPPFTDKMCGIHWPTAQATSLQNLVFVMSDVRETRQAGVCIENGSGGFLTDLVFYGGLVGAYWGNQQFTMRNLTFYNAMTAIYQVWDWGWTYKGIATYNCNVGVDMSNGGPTAQQIGSAVLIDSIFTDTATAIKTAHDARNQAATNGTLILENVTFNDVGVALQGPTSILLPGGTYVLPAWGQGHAYMPSPLTPFQGTISPVARPASLVEGGVYYQESKPQYEGIAASGFLSVRSRGAVGDGVHDDTSSLQGAIFEAVRKGQVLFFDAGYYRVTSTLYVPGGSRIVGEAYPVILAAGTYFANMQTPQAVVKVGQLDEEGCVEWSDMIVSTQGATAGATLIEWNLAPSAQDTAPSGMWDVHTRIGGFAGSQLQIAQCDKNPGVAIPPNPVGTQCIAAFMSMHITPCAGGLYMENVWMWVADHDIDDPAQGQITVYAGRGLYVESTAGTIWMYGTAVEHHTFYQYQLSGTRNVFMGHVQTESAYYQPNPPATMPFTAVAALNDPAFPPGCIGSPAAKNPCDGYGLRIINSQNVSVYGAGLYSFFSNYAQACLSTTDCQASILRLEGSQVSGINLYGLNTIGSQSMVNRGATGLVAALDNKGVAVGDSNVDCIAVFRG